MKLSLGSPESRVFSCQSDVVTKRDVLPDPKFKQSSAGYQPRNGHGKKLLLSVSCAVLWTRS